MSSGLGSTSQRPSDTHSRPDEVRIMPPPTHEGSSAVTTSGSLRPPTRRTSNRLVPNRLASGLPKRARVRLQVERDELLHRTAELDRALLAGHTERLAIAERLGELRETLWPRVRHYHGRRPNAEGRPPLRPLPPDHRYLSGRRLRSTCIAILHRHGRLPLTELHSLLHLYGFGVESPHAVKALADAMGYEARCHRVRRVERGVYEVDPGFHPRRGRFGHPDGLGPRPGPGAATEPVGGVGGAPMIDADVREDPSTWWPVPEWGR
jgi:hypothetical protein